MKDISSKTRHIPALENDRRPLTDRLRYDFSDYGFIVSGKLSEVFEIIPVQVNEAEAFLFFYPKEDLKSGRFSLFNLHAFLKYTGKIDEFAHSRGTSVSTIPLEATEAFELPALTYQRVISMKDLFEGAPQVIDFIGGTPDLVVRDSHTYFEHRHAHFYTGMLHEPNDNEKYDTLRQQLFAGVRLV
jgi:hypothetical protein